MALEKRIGKMFESITGVLIGAGKIAGPIAGKATKIGVKGAVNVGNKVMDGVEATIKADKKAMVGKAINNVKKVGAATVDNVLTDDKSYKRILDGGISKKLNLLDEVSQHTRAAGNLAYQIGAGAKIPFTKGKLKMPALLKTSDDSLIGLRATKTGTALAIGGAAIMGTPRGIKEFADDRKGYSDGQATGHAPSYTPAYLQNGGATGDLVFALNNLRQGGMM